MTTIPKLKLPRRTTRNKRLFNELADYITTYPEDYDQDDYGTGDSQLVDIEFGDGRVVEGRECGTTHCIAGLVGVFEGAHPVRFSYKRYGGEIVVQRKDWFFLSAVEGLILGSAEIAGRETPDGTVVDQDVVDSHLVNATDFAAAHLGITTSEANILFEGSWGESLTTEEVAAKLREYGDGAPIRKEY